MALGRFALDFGSTFDIEIGPMTGAQFDALLPGSKLHARVVAITRFAAGLGLDFILGFRLAAGEGPRLGLPRAGDGRTGPRLGQNTWLNGNSEYMSAVRAGFRTDGAGV